MGYVGKIKDSSGTTHLVASTLFGTCSTAIGTAAKVVTCSNFSQLENGVTIHVYFVNGNTAASPTLNVNSTGAIAVKRYGTTAPQCSTQNWAAGQIVSFTYYEVSSTDKRWVMNDIDQRFDLLTGTGEEAQDKGAGVSPRYFPAKWKFNLGKQPQDGDIITIRIPCAGHTNGVYISLDNGTNYKPVSVNNTDRLTTNYANGKTITLVYESSGQTNDMFNINGGDIRENITGGCWTVLNYFNTNSSVTQTNTTGNASYRVLFSSTADNTTRTEGARKSTKLQFNPSTCTLQLYNESTTAANAPATILFSMKDTTTGKTYSGGYIKVYQDHGATPNGDNMVINSGGGMFLGSGESPSSHYSAKGSTYTGEDCFITADGSLHLQANGNTIANRKGLQITNGFALVPEQADVATDNVGSIGTSSYRWANGYFTKINGVTPVLTDTTYTFATGDSNGQIKVTPSSGNAYNVDVKGLGDRAFDSTSYLPLTGGTLTGHLYNKSSNIARAGTAPSDDTVGNSSLYFKDTNDANMGMLAPIRLKTGEMALRLGPITTGANDAVGNLLELAVDTSGNRKTTFTDNTICFKSTNLDRNGAAPSSTTYGTCGLYLRDKDNENIGAIMSRHLASGEMVLRLGPIISNSAANYLDLAVDSDGNRTATLTNSTFYLNSTNITRGTAPSATVTGNGVMYFSDSGGNSIGMIKVFQDTSKNITLQFGAFATYNNSALANYLSITAKADGTRAYSVTDATAFRTAIGAGIGTVTQVKVGTTAYNPSSGVVSLPAYPGNNYVTQTVGWGGAASTAHRPVLFGYSYHTGSSFSTVTNQSYCVSTIYGDNNGTLTCKTLAQTSDRRNKKNIEVLDNRYLELIKEIEPKRFKFKDSDENKYHIGFITQEIEEKLSKVNLTKEDFGCLIENGAEDFQTLAYTDFIPILLMYTKELEKRIEILENKEEQ